MRPERKRMTSPNAPPDAATQDFLPHESHAVQSRISKMSWYARKVHRYEKMRWDQEPNRPVLPFLWGLEHIGGSANEPDPRGFLNRFAEETIARSEELQPPRWALV